MPENHPDIQRDFVDLIKALPRLQRGDGGTEFWMEFLELAQAIKRQVPVENQDLVTSRIHQVLTSCGISPPSWWTLASLSRPGRV